MTTTERLHLIRELEARNNQRMRDFRPADELDTMADNEKEVHPMEITLKMEKATKNTIRFEEILESELDAPKLGNIYIPKSTLAEIGWKEGNTITISMEVK